MDYLVDSSEWDGFVEIPNTVSKPVKIDVILEERLKAFLRKRLIKLSTSE